MITLRRFKLLEAAVRHAGFAATIEWSEALSQPDTPESLAEEAIYVVCNSGMQAAVAGRIYQRCLDAVRTRRSSASVFGHEGKAAAIDWIWQNRAGLFAAFIQASDKVEFCGTLPFVGPTTKHHLAKNLGVDVAKGDVHLERLALRDKCTPQRLCRRLAKQAGYRIATVDTILWRACAIGVLNSRIYLEQGWKAAFQPSRAKPTDAE